MEGREEEGSTTSRRRTTVDGRVRWVVVRLHCRQRVNSVSGVDSTKEDELKWRKDDGERRELTAVVRPVDALKVLLRCRHKRAKLAHPLVVLDTTRQVRKRDDAVVEDPPDKAVLVGGDERRRWARQDLRVKVGGEGRDGGGDEGEVGGDVVVGEGARTGERGEVEGR